LTVEWWSRRKTGDQAGFSHGKAGMGAAGADFKSADRKNGQRARLAPASELVKYSGAPERAFQMVLI
jgi:hypothetical protein